MLQAQHQLDQLGLRKPLEFLPIHRQDESYTGHLGKGVGNYPKKHVYWMLGLQWQPVSQRKPCLTPLQVRLSRG